jgi:hypothetical protein
MPKNQQTTEQPKRKGRNPEEIHCGNPVGFASKNSVEKIGEIAKCAAASTPFATLDSPLRAFKRAAAGNAFLGINAIMARGDHPRQNISGHPRPPDAACHRGRDVFQVIHLDHLRALRLTRRRRGFEPRRLWHLSRRWHPAGQ